jgi:hypothetical protein
MPLSVHVSAADAVLAILLFLRMRGQLVVAQCHHNTASPDPSTAQQLAAKGLLIMLSRMVLTFQQQERTSHAGMALPSLVHH